MKKISYILSLMLISSTVCTDTASAVINGNPTNELPFVAQILLPAGSSCTGTAVSPTKILTAVHCLPDICMRNFDVESGKIRDSAEKTEKLLSEIRVQGKDHIYLAKRVSCLDQYIISFAKSRFDVAIIELKSPHGLPLAQLSSVLPSSKDKVYVVGFGANSYSTTKEDNSVTVHPQGVGTKRFGSNRIVDIEDSEIRIKGRSSNRNVLGFENIGSRNLVDGTDALPFKGDSGGPLLNERGEVIGIASTTSVKYYGFVNVLRLNMAVYAMIANPEVARFIEAELHRPE
jgi:hypothetical protein